MALTLQSRASLNDGNKIPVVGFGTYTPEDIPKTQVQEAVKVALSAGYRHIDCALVYGCEAEVGRAIREKIADGTVKRDEIYYTTKLWNTFHEPHRVRVALEKSLKNAGLDYVDLFLMHYPMEFQPGDDPYPTDENGKVIYRNTDLRETWKAMEACKDAGLTKSIGVSNFNHKQLEYILSTPGLKHKPVINQVECHLFFNQSKLLEFCKSHDIQLVGYSVLGSTRDKRWIDQNSPVLLEDPVLKAIARKHGRTPAPVAMRYMLQRGVVVLASSMNPEWIRENLQVFEFELSEEEMKALDGRNLNARYVPIPQFKDHPQYPFSEEY